MGNITARTTVAATGLNAYLRSNDGDEEIDLYISDDLTVLVDNTNAATITDVASTYNWTRNGLFVLKDDSPVPTAAITITVPAVKRARVSFKNETAFNATITIAAQGEPPDVVEAGKAAVFTSDGTNIRVMGSSSAGTFLGLTDVDDSVYTAKEGFYSAVNATPDGMELVAPALELLTDVNSLAAAATGEVLAKASGGEAEWVAQSGGTSGDALPFVLSPTVLHSRIGKTVAQTSIGTAVVEVTFDETHEDSAGAADLSNNALKVPAGVTKVRLTSMLQILNAGSATSILSHFQKNDASLEDGSAPLVRVGLTSNTDYAVENISPILDVVENDSFTLDIQVGTDTTTDVSAISWMELEIIETTDTVPSLRTVVVSTPHKWRGASMVIDADKTTQNWSSNTIIPWDSVLRDTDSLADTANDQFVIPAGVSKVRVHGQLAVDLFGGTAVILRIYKNDSEIPSFRSQHRQDPVVATNTMQVVAPIIDVVEGDTIALYATMGSDSDVTMSFTDSWINIEIIEFASSTDAPVAYIAIPPEHKGAKINTTTAQTLSAAADTDIILENILFDTSFDPGDGGAPQRFWLGADWTFVDGDVTVGTDQITETAHGYQTGEGPITLTSSGTLPAGLALATKYWIIRVDANELKFATSRANALAGTDVDITAAAGGGTHTVVQEQYLVTPANVSKIKLHAQASTNDNNGTVTIAFHKDDFEFDQGSTTNHADKVGADLYSLGSGVIEAVEGNRFNLIINSNVGSSLFTGINNDTYFEIEVVEELRAITYPGVSVAPPSRGALIDFDVDNTTFDADPAVNVPFDNAVYDSDSFFNDTNDSLEIPTGLGITKVRVNANLRLGALDLATGVIATITKNASATYDGVTQIRVPPETTSDTLGISVVSPILDVADGDEFRLEITTSGDDSVTIVNQRTWLSIEVVETDEAAFPPEEIHFFQHAAPAVSDVLWMKVFNRRTTINDALAGSEGWAEGGASGGAVVYDIEIDDVKVGDFTWADTTGAAAAATLTTAASQQYVIAVGSNLKIVSPANIQSMSDISFNIAGFRS